MASMKTLLRLLGIEILTTVMATSDVACCVGKNNNYPIITMEPKVVAAFGFVDATNTSVSKVVVTVSTTLHVASWTSPQLSNITAAKLLASG